MPWPARFALAWMSRYSDRLAAVRPKCVTRVLQCIFCGLLRWLACCMLTSIYTCIYIYIDLHVCMLLIVVSVICSVILGSSMCCSGLIAASFGGAACSTLFVLDHGLVLGLASAFVLCLGLVSVIDFPLMVLSIAYLCATCLFSRKQVRGCGGDCCSSWCFCGSDRARPR